MNKLLPIAVVVAFLAVGGAILTWQLNSGPELEPADLPPYDYTLTESWIAQPESPPPPVWESGWEVDVILLAQTATAQRSPEDYAAALSAAGPIYAPRLRQSDFADDAGAALQHYVNEYNQGRAFVIASNEPLPAPLVPILNSDPMLHARFGGVLLLDGQDIAFAPGIRASAVCSNRFAAGEVCAEPVELNRENGAWVVAGEPPLDGSVLGGFTEWLEANARKLAPPLGDLEDVEIVEIRRPGQTD